MPRSTLDAEVHLEPIVRLRDQTVVGHEVRLVASTGIGLLAQPAEFGMTAEEVTRRTLREAGTRAHTILGKVHVDVTAHDLTTPLFAQDVEAAMGPSASRSLILEVIDHGALSNGLAFHRNVEALRDLGVQFTVEIDEAAGASADAVRLLQPELVKIRVSGTRSRGAGMAPGAKFAELARRIGAVPILDGIETQDDRRHGLDLRFDLGQGPLWPATVA